MLKNTETATLIAAKLIVFGKNGQVGLSEFYLHIFSTYIKFLDVRTLLTFNAQF